MSTEPQLDTRPAHPHAAIPVTAPMREWGRVNALVPEVYGRLGRRRIVPAGPLFYRYRVIGGMDVPFELEVGVPVPEPIEPDGRIIPGSIPPGRYATLTHHGHPDGLFDAITALQEWGTAQGITWDIRREGGTEIWGGRFEFYLTDPAVEPDMTKWSIELAYRLQDA